MRKLLFLLVLFPALTQGQDTLKYFKLQNSNVYFESVYEMQGSKEDIQKSIESRLNTIPTLADVNKQDGIITGRITKGQFPYKQYGYTLMTCPMLIRDYYSASFDIQIKDGKYKITVNGIRFDPEMELHMNGVSGKLDGTIEDYAYIKRKGELITDKNHAKFKAVSSFEDYLHLLFDFTQSPASDW